MSNYKIKQSTSFMAAALLLCAWAVSVVLLVRDVEDNVQTQAVKSKEHVEQLLIMRTAVESGRVAFADQIHEWNIILLRGGDSDEYKKHLEAFQQDNDEVDKFLVSAYEEAARNRFSEAQIFPQLLEDHQNVYRAYMKFLPNLTANGYSFANMVDVDKMLNGVDRNLASNLGNVSTLMGSETLAATIKMTQASNELIDSHSTALWITGIIQVLFVLVLIRIYWITRHGNGDPEAMEQRIDLKINQRLEERLGVVTFPHNH